MADQLDAQMIIDNLSKRIADGVVREAMQEVYSKQLEKKIEELQRELRRANNGLASVSSSEATGETDREPFVL